MTEKTRVLNRMFDVLIALREAERHKKYLTRIELQKFIYLVDSVSNIYEFMPPQEGHKTYFNGPYDLAIQNAVDSLAFRGLVKILSIELSQKKSIKAI